MDEQPQMMHAWRIRTGHENPLYRTRVPIPKPAPDSVLIKIQASGLCHSDCMIRQGATKPDPSIPGWTRDFTVGHEGAGEIIEIGSGIDESKFKVGDQVAIHIVPGCGECQPCQTGYHQICKQPDNGNYGLGKDGLFAEYASIKAKACVKVPEDVSIEEAAVASDAVLTAFHAVKYAADVKPEQTIVIYGLGGLGLNGLQTAKHLGVKRILACDRSQKALDVAIKLGVAPEDAFCTADPEAKPIHEVVKEKGISVDTAIDFVGHEQTILSSQLTVRDVGLVVLVGLLSEKGPMIPFVMTTKYLTYRGSYNGTVDGLRECMDLIAKGVLRPQIETIAIKHLPQVMDDLDEGKYQGRKVLLPDWNDEHQA